MPPGRPSSYSEDLVDVLLERIAGGESLRAIAKAPGMPSQASVFRWLDDPDRTEFRERYARARERQADAMDEMILAAAVRCTDKNSNATRVKIDAFKWRAAHLAPKKYGKKQTVDVNANLTLADLVSGSYKAETE